jgi:hypothetical protein
MIWRDETRDGWRAGFGRRCNGNKARMEKTGGTQRGEGATKTELTTKNAKITKKQHHKFLSLRTAGS